MSIDLVTTPEPHFIPGYTGYCPQYRYRIADTYGSRTHKLLVDTTINRSEKLVLSDRTVDDYEVFRPPQRDIDVVTARFRQGDPVYKHPIIPGYEGFIPGANARMGQRFMVTATEALSEFEQQQTKDRAAQQQLQRITQLQDSRYCPRDLEDKTLTKSQFRLPLQVVRPEHTGVLRKVPTPEPALLPPRNSTSPYFKENSDPEKHFKSGFAGQIPFGYSRYGESHEPYTNSALCDFSSNYRQRQSTEWAPVSVLRPDPPLLFQPTEIYHKHVGMLPHYLGHIPGEIFRYGKTFGNDTRDAKRWLRGDFAT